jgi:hypothetical protein
MFDVFVFNSNETRALGFVIAPAQKLSCASVGYF